ncbi:hypothetical protein MMIC_P0003 [Mariprofundus micogutta]|uniref:Uncharacterized protein n=2 Tax=Mariprofundus micogutta TaxID=1921010 RepID=A0A1L8CJL3_9PROT|nr:hypothetical protein MMIC_P0003 [Mariprofundus micogutta]
MKFIFSCLFSVLVIVSDFAYAEDKWHSPVGWSAVPCIALKFQPTINDNLNTSEDCSKYGDEPENGPFGNWQFDFGKIISVDEERQTAVIRFDKWIELEFGPKDKFKPIELYVYFKTEVEGSVPAGQMEYVKSIIGKENIPTSVNYHLRPVDRDDPIYQPFSLPAVQAQAVIDKLRVITPRSLFGSKEILLYERPKGYTAVEEKKKRVEAWDLEAEVVELFGVKFISATKQKMDAALLSARVSKIQGSKFKDTYDSSGVLDGSKDLQLRYNLKDELSEAVYTFPAVPGRENLLADSLNSLLSKKYGVANKIKRDASNFDHYDRRFGWAAIAVIASEGEVSLIYQSKKPLLTFQSDKVKKQLNAF